MCTSNFNGTISSNDPLFGLRGLVGFVIRIPWSLCSDTSRYACLTPSKECVLNAVMSVACGWMSWIALLPFRDVYIVSILLSSSLNKAYYLLLFILIDMCLDRQKVSWRMICLSFPIIGIFIISIGSTKHSNQLIYPPLIFNPSSVQKCTFIHLRWEIRVIKLAFTKDNYTPVIKQCLFL